MAHIIDLGWSDKYAVSEDFDLNVLKDFVKVEQKDGGYTVDHGERGFSIILNKHVDFRGGLVPSDKYEDEKRSHRYTKEKLEKALSEVSNFKETLHRIESTIISKQKEKEEGGDS